MPESDTPASDVLASGTPTSDVYASRAERLAVGPSHNRRQSHIAKLAHSRFFQVTALLSAAVLFTIVLAVVAGTASKKSVIVPPTKAAVQFNPCCQPHRPGPSPKIIEPTNAETAAMRSNTTRGTSAPDPSGVPMPTGNVPGWSLVYSQDFNGSNLPPNWRAYSGMPGNDPYGSWDPANVTVSNGELHLGTTANDDAERSNTYSTGGVDFYGNPQVYGMYLVRMKGDYEPNLKISDIALLWPSGGQNIWPPEIDFFEDNGGDRSSFTATLHPGPNGNNCCMIAENLANSAGQWHTYGVEWTPTSITFTIDGKQWGKVIYKNQLAPPAKWPSIPMDLVLQSQNLGPAQPATPIDTLSVAWVVEYKQTS